MLERSESQWVVGIVDNGSEQSIDEENDLGQCFDDDIDFLHI